MYYSRNYSSWTCYILLVWTYCYKKPIYFGFSTSNVIFAFVTGLSPWRWNRHPIATWNIKHGPPKGRLRLRLTKVIWPQAYSFMGYRLAYGRTEHVITLTHWGWVTHRCVGKLTIIGSDNGLSPGRRQAIIWTNAGILLIKPLGTNFS